MSIVKEIIELHGGNVTVNSTLGQGCTVCLLLPAASPEAVPEADSAV